VAAQAPGRIDLAGGGTDPEPYASDFGGAVLNLAITLRAHVTIEPLASREVAIESLDFGESDSAPLGGRFRLGGRLDLLKAIVHRFLEDASRLQAGFRVTTRTELPPGSGLGSSAALGVALITALSRYLGRPLSRHETADLHSAVERFDLGIWGGKQDPFAAACGGLRFWRFEGERVIDEPHAIPPSVIADLERNLKLVYSGEAHLSGDIHKEILLDYRRGQSRVKAAQHRLKEVASELRAALERGDLRAAARLLDENWKAHQQLHPSCATERLHDSIRRGKEAGAWGAKVCGAGGGGAIVFYVPPERHASFARAMTSGGAALLSVSIDTSGCESREL
jgi:D-glycero-alpha-D-manno-heptose-7-phosphate kinase